MDTTGEYYEFRWHVAPHVRQPPTTNRIALAFSAALEVTKSWAAQPRTDAAGSSRWLRTTLRILPRKPLTGTAIIVIITSALYRISGPVANSGIIPHLL